MSEITSAIHQMQSVSDQNKTIATSSEVKAKELKQNTVVLNDLVKKMLAVVMESNLQV